MNRPSLSPPDGLRDLLPPESRARRTVGQLLQAEFARSGYELVTTPLFERAEVFTNGASLVDSRDLMRFVEPDTGEVVAMRPDITPQVARVVATQLADHPAPWRIRYEGTVIRRRRGRARRQQQIAQAGIEHIGQKSARGDVEVIRLITQGCERAGLSGYRLELSQVAIGQALLSGLSDATACKASRHLACKDVTQLEIVLREAGASARERKRVLHLVELHGDASVLERANKSLKGTPAEKPLRRLQKVAQTLVATVPELTDRLCFDLGEVRGAAYYTGTSFHVLAEGPGEAVASGGRYDRLVHHYGRSEPAVGAAIDLENLLWALDHAGYAWRNSGQPRLVVAGRAQPRVDQLAALLRERGCVAATLPSGDLAEAENYGRAWSYDVALLVKGTRVEATRLCDNVRQSLSETACEELVAWGSVRREG